MALVKKTVLDKIEVVGPYKSIQLRYDNQIIDDSDDSIVVDGKFSRRVVHCIDDISSETTEIKEIAAAVWTEELKTAYEAQLTKGL